MASCGAISVAFHCVNRLIGTKQQILLSNLLFGRVSMANREAEKWAVVEA